jgi:hypothetical protein
MAAYNPHLASDTALPLADLHDHATRRVQAARHLAHLLTTVTFAGADATDLSRTCEVFDLLLEDACDSLAAMENRV